MKRISSNESFPRNIILSIDSDEKNYSKNLEKFRNVFQKSLEEGLMPQDAVEKATSALRRSVSGERFKYVEEKPKASQLLQEGDVLKRKSKEQRKIGILSAISSNTGVTDVSELEKLWKMFVIKRRSTESDANAIKRTVDTYNRSKRESEGEKIVEVPEYSPELVDKYKNIIKILDKENYDQNMKVFYMSLSRGNTIEETFEKIQKLIRIRRVMRENDIEMNSTNIRIFFKNGDDFEKSIRTVRERDRTGSLPVEQEMISNTDEDVFVNYNGERVSLKRIVKKLYGNLVFRDIKYAFGKLREYIFDHGLDVDEAVNKVNKLLIIKNKKSEIVSIFPGNDELVMTIFRGYFIEDDLPYEQALSMTKDDVFNPSN